MKIILKFYSYRKYYCIFINCVSAFTHSCYAFPALHALEGYLKQLFEMENILVERSFSSLFGHDTKINAFHLKKDIIKDLKNPKIEPPLVEVYSYLNKNRHTLFHTEQLLITTRILED